MEKHLKYICISFFWVCCLINPAFAQNGTLSKDIDKDWKFEVAAYAFAFGVTGDAQFRGADVDVDIGFDDILDNLDFGASGAFHGQKGRWSFLIDAVYFKISDDASRARRNLLSANLEVEFEQTVIAGYGGYRFIDGITNDLFERVNVDFITGLRYNKLSSDLGINATLIGIPLSAKRDKTVDWVDPVIGLKTQAFFSDNIRLTIWGDYGGFGAGADRTWQTIGTLAYTFQNGVDLFAGYRAYNIDYEEGSGSSRSDFDLIYKGPILGVGYQF